MPNITKSKTLEEYHAECIEMEKVIYLIDHQLQCLISLTKDAEHFESLKGHELAAMFEGLQAQLKPVM